MTQLVCIAEEKSGVSVYIYIHTISRVYIYIQYHVCIYIYIHTYIHIRTCIYIYIYIILYMNGGKCLLPCYMTGGWSLGEGPQVDD